MMHLRIPRFGHLSRAVSYLAVASLLVGSVGAQDRAAEKNFNLSVSQSLRATDNQRLNATSAGTTTAADTRVSFGYRFETGLQALSLDGSAAARLRNDPVLGSSSGLGDADFNLGYQLDGAQSRLQFQSQYQRTELLFLDPLQADEVTAEDLTANNGRRRNINTSLEFETGLTSVVGLQLRLNQQQRRYSGTNDDALFDTDTYGANLALPLRLSTTTEAALNLSYSDYEAEDTPATRRKNRRWSIGVTKDLSEISRLSLEVGRGTVVETFDTLPGVEDRETGNVITAAWNRDLPNGLLGARYNTDITQEGRRSSLRVERRFDLPDGSLFLAAGASDGRTTSARPVGEIRWRQETARTTFSAALSRAVAVSDTTSEVTETTRVSLETQTALSPLSSLSLGLRYATIAEPNGPADEVDQRRASFGASFNRQLTEDWNLVTGYQYSHARRETGISGDSNSLFLTVRRTLGGQ